MTYLERLTAEFFVTIFDVCRFYEFMNNPVPRCKKNEKTTLKIHFFLILCTNICGLCYTLTDLPFRKHRTGRSHDGLTVSDVPTARAISALSLSLMAWKTATHGVDQHAKLRAKRVADNHVTKLRMYAVVIHRWEGRGLYSTRSTCTV